MARPLSPRAIPFALLAVIACSDETPTRPSDAAYAAAPAACAVKSNNDVKKLADCVTLEAVRGHEAALQQIADANGGTRSAGTAGYTATVTYVENLLRSAGYAVERQGFEVEVLTVSSATLEQVAPIPTAYGYGTGFGVMAWSGSGNVTATVEPVDLQLAPPQVNTSGCEPEDFIGFPAGAIALMQRGTCAFRLKALNAQAAGAVGAIIINQGNTPDRTGLFPGTLGGPGVTIPVVAAAFPIGIELSQPGAVAHLQVSATTSFETTYNVLAETNEGAPGTVIMAGGMLDSPRTGPGINGSSGAAVLLETALQMARVKTRNRVRFAFWSGSIVNGAIPYLERLYTAGETGTILGYLDFRAVGSPNYARFVIDGATLPAGSGVIEGTLAGLHTAAGLPFLKVPPASPALAEFARYGIPGGGIDTGTLEIKTPAEAAIYGGTAGVSYDPCAGLPCDTYANVSLAALDASADLAAGAILSLGMNAEALGGAKGKGNFRPVAPALSPTSF